MKTRALLVWFVFSLALVTWPQVQAKDEVRMSYPSKVEASKGKAREKLFTPWMTNAEIRAHNDERWKKGEQLVYFEYDITRAQWRAIFSSKVKLSGQYSWWAFIDEKEMETKLSEEIKGGRQPAFIVRDNGSYAMMFISPEDAAAMRTELTALGIGEPRLKK